MILERSQLLTCPVLPAVNLVAIAVLLRGRCGLSRCITRYLVAMAAGALTVIISDPILKMMRLIYFPHSLLNTWAACCLLEVLVSAATESCVWFTMAFTFDRFVAICCLKLKARYCTERVATVVIGGLCLLCSLESIPWYFVYEPEYVINGVAWACQEKPSFYHSATWASYEVLHLLLTPCIPFVLILLFNALTVRYVLVVSRGRQRLTRQGTKDTELQSRRRSLILLFTISGSFILLWTTKVLFHIYHRLVPYSFVDNVMGMVAESTGDMLQVLSSCTNTFIYTVTQTPFRAELRRGITYPLHWILQFVK
ncbi:probable G-protein coupled receptor 139 [Narcine bancroftii]|uniref:probable G-protein coupled receptor 139 n=1 Tax=Narcine bancroftii TaxID=1343680 RepID=UPI0038320448